MIARVLSALALLWCLSAPAFAGTPTTNYGWTKPTAGADADTWGAMLNTDLDSIDTTVFGMLPKAGGTLTGLLVLDTGTTTLAPLKFVSGTNLTSPVAGVVEWNGTNLFITQTSGPTRKTLAFTDSTLTGNTSGSAATLTTPRTFTYTGDATGGPTSFDGSSNVSTALTVVQAPKLTTGRTISITGDVAYTSPSFDGSGNVTAAGTIQSGVVTGAKIASATVANSNLVVMADQTFKGNVSGGSASPSDLTVTQMATALSGQTASTVANGADARFSALPQGSHSAAYGMLLADAGLELYHPSADTTARIWTIPANASVAFPVATKIEIVNDCSAGVLTVAITSDTLEWFPAGTTGSRSIAACGMATLTKVTATRWAITGVGVS